MGDLITEMLRGFNVKNLFRAYLNLGLMAKVLGHDRMLKCAAATDFVFIDPWSDMYGCNVRPDLKLGNLHTQDWDDIWRREEVMIVRDHVSSCMQNCWMVGSAKTAMRHPKYVKLPKAGPLMWVIYNKLIVMLGGNVKFERYVNYKNAYQDTNVTCRKYFLNETVKKKLQSKDEVHYRNFGEFLNR